VARQAAFARMQKTILERVYAVPFGSLTKVQATRRQRQGLQAVPLPRFSNVLDMARDRREEWSVG